MTRSEPIGHHAAVGFVANLRLPRPGFDENIESQGELILQDSFQVWDPKTLIRKGRERHLFLFEMSLVFSKEVKDSNGRSKYIYKSKLFVSGRRSRRADKPNAGFVFFLVVLWEFAQILHSDLFSPGPCLLSDVRVGGDGARGGRPLQVCFVGGPYPDVRQQDSAQGTTLLLCSVPSEASLRVPSLQAFYNRTQNVIMNCYKKNDWVFNYFF